jgi:hypothetical protein
MTVPYITESYGIVNETDPSIEDFGKPPEPE